MTAPAPTSTPSVTSREELDAAVERAQTAFELARDVDLATRAGWLESIAAALEEAAGPLVDVGCRETHLGPERLRGELRRTVFQLRLLAHEVQAGEHLDAIIDHEDPDWGMGPRPDLRRVNIPLGVVGVFGASNFPFAFSVMGGDSASALAAGCAVVHKGHDGHPELAALTAEAVRRGLEEASAPAGLFSLVTGRQAGVALVEHPLVKAVGFTGSTAGGRALLDRIAARPEPVPFFGELGGINAVFVTRRAWEARRPEILAGYAASFTLGMGQFCTKPGLLFVPSSSAGEVRDRIAEALEGFRPAPLLTERLHEGYTSAVSSVAGREGVEVLLGGTFDEAPHPTVLATTADAVRRDPGILRQEMFGPASIVVQYRDEAELAGLADLLEGQLTTGVHAEADDDLDGLCIRLAEISGRVLWNGWPTGVTVSYAQHHGGPYPASTSMSTSVGTAAIRRFLRPVAFQSWPQDRLPMPLRDENPWQVPQRIDGVWHRPGGDRA